MTFATLSDIKDELLRSLVIQSDLDEAQEFIYDLAKGLGVDPEKILSPIPFKIKKLAIAYASMTRAKLKSGMNPKSFQGTDGGDAYELKRRIYEAEVKELISEITVETLIGKDSTQKEIYFSPEIEIFRA